VKLEKSANKIKEQLEFWLLKYYVKERSDLSGKELFTIFDLMDSELKANLTKNLNLRKDELPALSLKISEDSYIINTTERFIRLTKNQTNEIEYINFESHLGYGDFVVKKRFIRKHVNVKTEGYYSDFVIKTKTGEKIEWRIPTGTPGFGFWNVTKKCELIGRKYLKNKTTPQHGV
jgi:hypothetical protein